jgi:hypothetical protein
MNKTAQKHLDAIRAGKVDRSNIIGLRKLINASERKAHGWSIGATASAVDIDDLDTIESAIDEFRPIVVGALHESGLALLRSKRYAKQLHWLQSFIARIDHFRLVRFDRFNGNDWHSVPVYSVHDASGSHLFTFRNIPWQSGGNGPEIQGRDF